MAGRATRKVSRKSKKLRGGNVPTFHFLITSAGRPSLERMLKSLRGEVSENDAITVVFDGPEAQSLAGYKDTWKNRFKCPVNIIVEPEKVGEWGHKLRDKYQATLTPKTTFVMHADDDDAYIKGFLNTLRKECSDPNTLYIGRMKYNRNTQKVVPNSTDNFTEGNIGTPNGIIPYDMVGKGQWPTIQTGDFEYYKSLMSHNPPIKYLDKVFYKVYTNTNNSTNKTKKQSGGSHGNIYVFYHIYCNPHTLDVVKDQVTKILYSGLYDDAKNIYCYLAGKKEHIDKVYTYIHTLPPKFVIKEVGVDDKSYERFTLNKIADLVQDNDKLLYIHSKGVSKDNNMNNIDLWRGFMEYFLIKRYKECLEKLNSGKAVAGVLYKEVMIGPHFSGNFWWSTGAYYKSLAKSHKIGSNYYDTEAYIFKNRPSFAAMDEGKIPPMMDLYRTPMLPKFYMDKKVADIKV